MGKFNFNEKDFEILKQKAEDYYHSIVSVWCPYFQEKISFNAKGLRHLKFKSDERARTERDQYARLKLLPFVPEVLNKSKTVQGINKTRLLEEEKNNGQWKRAMKDVTFYEFIAVLENVRIKVIVKEVFGGGKHFLSVIPSWKIDKEHGKRILCSDDAVED
jgi:hypothetical protein